MKLVEIPIRIENPAGGAAAHGLESSANDRAEESAGLGGGVTALLAELAQLLERLAAERAPAAIDLRSLPMSIEDRQRLARALGDGEVQATVCAGGLTTLRETRLAGVWWVEHRNPEGELVAELLEVAPVPAFLASVTEDIAESARALRQELRRGHDGAL